MNKDQKEKSFDFSSFPLEEFKIELEDNIKDSFSTVKCFIKELMFDLKEELSDLKEYVKDIVDSCESLEEGGIF